MRKSFSLLVALALLMACAALSGPAAYGAEKTPMTAGISVSPWPDIPENTIPVFYGPEKCLLLPGPGEMFVPALYDTASGDVSEVLARRADTEKWTEMALGTLMGYGIEYSDGELEYLLEGLGPMGLFFAGMQGQNHYESHSVHGSVLLVKTRYTGLAIFLETGVMRPVDACALLDGGRYVTAGEDTGMYVIHNPDASTVDVEYAFDPGFECGVIGLGFGQDSAAVIAVEQTASRNAVAGFTVGFIDSCGVGSVSGYVDVGRFILSSGPDEALVCGPGTAIVFKRAALPVYPPVLVDSAAGEARALVWDGSAMSAIPTDELAGESGAVSVKDVTDRYLYPLGVSDDGRYAAFVESRQGDLLITDITTLETRLAVSGDDIEAAGLSPMLSSLVCWDGGVITGKNGYNIVIEQD